ncbi:restriction endonuclease subunit S [Acinetobacter brisouii]
MENNSVSFTTLGNLIELLTDYHANGAYEKLKENVNLLDKENHAVMIRTTNFEANDFTNNLIYIDEHAYEFLKKSKVYTSDLIMNKIANPGTVYFMPNLSKPVSLGMNLFLIRIDPKKADPYFVYAYLRKNEYYVKSFASGSTTKTITKDDVRRLKIYSPPLPEQKKIAQILSTWDQAITATEQLLANSQQQKKALMQQLLTGKKRLLDDSGVVFSGEWFGKSLKKLLSIAKGQQLNRDTLTSTGAFPVINGGLEPSGYTDKYNTEANSITISEGGNSCGYVSYQKRPFWCGGHCYTLGNLKLNIEFTYQILKFNQTKIMRLRVGSGLPNIQKKDLESLIISYPKSFEEQQKIATVLSTADQEIEALQKKLEHLKQEKKALMQQLLTGKRRVKVEMAA